MEEVGINEDEEELIDSLFYKCDLQHEGRVQILAVIQYLKSCLGNTNSEHDLMALASNLEDDSEDGTVAMDTYRDVLRSWIIDIRKRKESTSFLEPDGALQQHIDLDKSGSNSSSNTDMSGFTSDKSNFSAIREGSVHTTEYDVNELLHETEDLKFQNRRLADEAEQLRRQLEIQEELFSTRAKEEDTLKKKIKSLLEIVELRRCVMDENEELKTKLLHLQEIRREQDCRAVTLEREISSMQNNIQHFETQWQTACAELETVRKELHVANTACIQHKHNLLNEKELVSANEEILEQQLRELGAWKDRCDLLAEENVKLSADKEDIQMTLAQLNTKLQRYEGMELLDETEESATGGDTQPHKNSPKLRFTTPHRSSICMELKDRLKEDLHLPSPLCEKGQYPGAARSALLPAYMSAWDMDVSTSLEDYSTEMMKTGATDMSEDPLDIEGKLAHLKDLEKDALHKEIVKLHRLNLDLAEKCHKAELKETELREELTETQQQQEKHDAGEQSQAGQEDEAVDLKDLWRLVHNTHNDESTESGGEFSVSADVLKEEIKLQVESLKQTLQSKEESLGLLKAENGRLVNHIGKGIASTQSSLVDALAIDSVTNQTDIGLQKGNTSLPIYLATSCDNISAENMRKRLNIPERFKKKSPKPSEIIAQNSDSNNVHIGISKHSNDRKTCDTQEYFNVIERHKLNTATCAERHKLSPASTSMRPAEDDREHSIVRRNSYKEAMDSIVDDADNDDDSLDPLSRSRSHSFKAALEAGEISPTSRMSLSSGTSLGEETPSYESDESIPRSNLKPKYSSTPLPLLTSAKGEKRRFDNVDGQEEYNKEKGSDENAGGIERELFKSGGVNLNRMSPCTSKHLSVLLEEDANGGCSPHRSAACHSMDSLSSNKASPDSKTQDPGLNLGHPGHPDSNTGQPDCSAEVWTLSNGCTESESTSSLDTRSAPRDSGHSSTLETSTDRRNGHGKQTGILHSESEISSEEMLVYRTGQPAHSVSSSSQSSMTSLESTSSSALDIESPRNRLQSPQSTSHHNSPRQYTNPPLQFVSPSKADLKHIRTKMSGCSGDSAEDVRSKSASPNREAMSQYLRSNQRFTPPDSPVGNKPAFFDAGTSSGDVSKVSSESVDRGRCPMYKRDDDYYSARNLSPSERILKRSRERSKSPATSMKSTDCHPSLSDSLIVSMENLDISPSIAAMENHDISSSIVADDPEIGNGDHAKSADSTHSPLVNGVTHLQDQGEDPLNSSDASKLNDSVDSKSGSPTKKRGRDGRSRYRKNQVVSNVDFNYVMDTSLTAVDIPVHFSTSPRVYKSISKESVSTQSSEESENNKTGNNVKIFLDPKSSDHNSSEGVNASGSPKKRVDILVPGSPKPLVQIVFPDKSDLMNSKAISQSVENMIADEFGDIGVDGTQCSRLTVDRVISEKLSKSEGDLRESGQEDGTGSGKGRYSVRGIVEADDSAQSSWNASSTMEKASTKIAQLREQVTPTTAKMNGSPDTTSSPKPKHVIISEAEDGMTGENDKHGHGPKTSYLSKIRENHLAKRRDFTRQNKMPQLSELTEKEAVCDNNNEVKAIANTTIEINDDVIQPPEPNSDIIMPSIPDEFLQKLGLISDGSSSEELSDQEIESKFTSLSLAFKTDQQTLEKRLEIQERSRDIAEQNVDKELQGLRQGLETLNQICTDPQVREVLTKIQNHIDILEKSTARVSSRAEVFGAIQQEKRMSKAVEIMIHHVENLRRVHEREHAELEEARKLLQDSRSLAPSTIDLQTGGELLSRRSASVCQNNMFTGKASRRRVSEIALPKVLGGSGAATLHPSSSMRMSLASTRTLVALNRMDARSRFQAAVAHTTVKSAVANTLRRASLEKQNHVPSVSPSHTPPAISRDNSTDSAAASKTSEVQDKEKQKNMEEEAFKKGYEQGLRAHLGQDLSGLREQQNHINESLGEIMDSIDNQMEEPKSLKEILVERLHDNIPKIHISSLRIRMTFGCFFIVMAIVSVIVSLFPSSAANLVGYRHYGRPPV